MDEYKSKLKEWYDKTASRYDSWGEREGETACGDFPEEIGKFNKLLKFVKLNPTSKVIDIATGTGNYLIEVLKKGGIGYGIDISGEMLKNFRKKIIKLGMENKIKELRGMDASNLKYPDNFFDFALCIGLYDYYDFEEVSIFLNEIKRVCKNNSFIIIDFPNKKTDKVYLFRDKERLVGHEVYIHDIDEIREFLKKQGFDIIAEMEAGIELQFLLKIVR
jgi:ubiquinone/menaquinone biosynthesis C-methylase UbiE